MSTDSNTLDFVRYVLEQVCQHKADIVVEQTEDSIGTLISVSVNEEDMGKLIGKGGQTISALRLLVRAMGARDNAKINLKVLEPVAE
jgi:uncharacterized protein